MDPTSSLFIVPFLHFDGTQKAELHLSAAHLAFLKYSSEPHKPDKARTKKEHGGRFGDGGTNVTLVHSPSIDGFVLQVVILVTLTQIKIPAIKSILEMDKANIPLQNSQSVSNFSTL